jgi:hypothetical protein
VRNFILILALLTFGGLSLNASEKIEGKSQSTTSFSSLYTDFSDKYCETFDSEESGSDGTMECKGIGGYKVSVWYNTYGHEIASVKSPDGDFSTTLTKDGCGVTHNYGGRLEWRLANGNPFACIVRITCLEEGEGGGLSSWRKVGEYLLVKGLKGYGGIDFEVDVGRTKNPNERARELADENYLNFSQ